MRSAVVMVLISLIVLLWLGFRVQLSRKRRKIYEDNKLLFEKCRERSAEVSKELPRILVLLDGRKSDIGNGQDFESYRQRVQTSARLQELILGDISRDLDSSLDMNIDFGLVLRRRIQNLMISFYQNSYDVVKWRIDARVQKRRGLEFSRQFK